MQPYEKQRKDLLEKIESEAKRRIALLQNSFYIYILEALEDQLIVDGNIIKTTNKNIVAANNLGLVEQKFRREKVNPLLRWMAKAFVSVMKINAHYFRNNITPKLGSVQRQAESKLLTQLGLTFRDKKMYLAKNGWLSQLGNFQDPYIKVRQMATQAVADGIKLKDFKKELKKYIVPDMKNGALERHFYTNANDAFSQFDRTVQNEYANRLELKAFVYTGGTIDGTRDFCRVNNRQVFTRDESDEWRGREWQGKNADYVPLRDLGGHNCRHFPTWISDKRAIRLRPELKDIL